MLAEEYILIDISLIHRRASWTNVTELWDIPLAFDFLLSGSSELK
jgi:hypothetical protein